ncbi:MAG: isocitrate lyase/phosphoenolpyruvate mutase family protein [Alphaproteobacteria bacterium]|jgi:2-methylisocitrate lyase-like PEP mutase family enzyme|nr:isocitrate lyase/phosphoenolpyruvate mutase family protein [Alphaproteobacteria bacterium]MBU0804080.1 isocitrate lyase/phosphoenolpyruvate mutase family protein [Alphaproteobacteria bacterium]MBU0872623.1 isocitrate lyase/phosphoenolpyruvate mutase family protein [Alphaproteobacteria bacterium]MBU1403635.1 isocitrate lyase/phosphoenolpyruvate mutase family protein [Alphaproteobacteria bacterium]MBU1593662.1 isocitrate lyase/phosphoenolpyruvate mutase family protein [Alphaproteobacteria bact
MDKGKIFRDLHRAGAPFIIPNPWDVGTAKLLASCGFRALATTSAGFAFSRGLPDGGVGFETMIQHCREMAAATDLPVSADLERGKGDSPESAAETVFAAAAAGLAGCSIEDHTGDAADPIYDFSLAVERVAAAAEAARALKSDFVFTARAENYLWGRPDIDDTIRRLQAFEAAGADVLYAPGLADTATVGKVCSAVSRPVNVLAVADFSVAALAAAGAARISLGSKLTTYAFGMVERAAKEMLDGGSFGFARDAMPFSRAQALFARPDE